ncbi:hypothetical protein F4678DRAFT_364006 [Xylaria arbuscula]|nr:hypothetical protein F4678DRAFT_364006 [Xylaria arbuscula]
MALGKLPPTLFSTYERILENVEASNAHVKTLVQRSLLLLVLVPHIRLRLNELCEAVSVPDDADTFEEDEVIDEMEIRFWCSSLVRTSLDGSALEFAHYTAQQFLCEVCLTHPTLNFYHVSHEKTRLLLGQVCLRYITFKNHERYPEANDSEISYISNRNSSRPLYEYAAIGWRTCVIDLLENDSISRLLIDLFDTRKSASFQAWALELIRHCLVNKKREVHSRYT